MDPVKARQHRFEPVKQEYTTKDVVTYALGIGCTVKDDLHYVYENHDNFQVFPMYAIRPAMTSQSLADVPAFDLSRILHGEQYIELFDLIPDSGRTRTEIEVLDILDKGSAAVILTNTTTYDDITGKKLAFCQFATFQMGSGKFGGPRTNAGEKKAVAAPKRKPDKVVEVPTGVDQAALYRYGGGDMNPLHVDAAFAKTVGFDQPILHGMCTMSLSAHAVLRAYGANDARAFKAVKARFSAPVIPGQTLKVEMWKEGSRVHFQTSVKETGKNVIANAYLDLNVAGSSTAVRPSTTGDELVSDTIFQTINDQLANQKDVVSKVKAIVVYDITKEGKHAAFYTLDLKNGAGSAYKGEPSEKAAVTVTVDDQDFLKVVTGELSGMKAFMSGKLKARGNVLILQKLQGILAGATKAKL